jgi:hypothetical protein
MHLSFILGEKKIILPEMSETHTIMYNNWVTPPKSATQLYDCIILELVTNVFAPIVFVGTQKQMAEGIPGVFVHPINRPKVMEELSGRLDYMFDHYKRAWVKLVRLGFEPEEGIGIA